MLMHPSGKNLPVLLIVSTTLLLLGLAVGYYFGFDIGFERNSQKACTTEAKLCPDGSAVGRSGPNCEFAPCPGE
jgi:hypothetical protein